MIATLHRIPLFEDLKEEHLQWLEPLFEPFSCRAGTAVIKQGAPADYLYLVMHGAVEVYYKPYDAPAITVTHITEGGVFGWSAVVGSERYTSSVISINELSAIRIHGEDLRRLCISHPEAGKIILDRLARAVSSRWKDAQEQVKSILANGMTGEKRKRAKKENGEAGIVAPPNYPVEEQLRGLIDQLSAYVETYHGGSVDFVSFDGKTLHVRLGGACLGCPLVPATLSGWVAGTVHQFFPDVEVVSAE